MSGWDDLRTVLAEATSPVQLTWPDLHRIVGHLPPSASTHRAWWSGDRPHVRAWTSAGYRISALTLGREVTFVRSHSPTIPAPSDRDRVRATPPPASPHSPTGDVLLVTCVKDKRNTPAAVQDLPHLDPRRHPHPAA